jgi:hypothetical protein
MRISVRRAMTELNIDVICANTPAAKGRVERAHQTLQDRLVKELRLRGICTMDETNRYLPFDSRMSAVGNAREGRSSVRLVIFAIIAAHISRRATF